MSENRNNQTNLFIAICLGAIALLVYLLHRAEKRAEGHHVEAAGLVGKNELLTEQLAEANERAQGAEHDAAVWEVRAWNRGLNAVIAFILAGFFMLLSGLYAFGVLPTEFGRRADHGPVRLSYDLSDCTLEFSYRLDPYMVGPDGSLRQITPDNDAQPAITPINIIDMTEAEWPSLTGIELVQDRDPIHNVPGILVVGDLRLQFWQNSVIVVETGEPPVIGEVYDVADFSFVGPGKIGQVYLTQDPALRLLPTQ